MQPQNVIDYSLGPDSLDTEPPLLKLDSGVPYRSLGALYVFAGRLFPSLFHAMGICLGVARKMLCGH